MRRKKSGFTLVELLAVIVILAIIMIIAIPSVLEIMTTAKQKSFVEYITKVYTAAQDKYMSDQLFNGDASCIVYKVKTDLGLSNTGTYDGFVLIGSKDKDGDQKYYITLWNDEYKVYGLDYKKVDKAKLEDFVDENDDDLKIDGVAKYYDCSVYTDGDGNTITADDVEITPTGTPRGKTCTFDGDMVPGAKFIDGQYTYTYKDKTAIENQTVGWHVVLTDKKSTEPVTTQLCSTINGEYVTSFFNTFHSSKATSIDLSSFNTSHATDLTSMFYYSSATSLDVSGFDTRNVKYMGCMFYHAAASDFDVSNFNTSKVEVIEEMFNGTHLDKLDLRHFDVSHVRDVYSAFGYMTANEVDVSNWNLVNAPRLYNMFTHANIKKLNVSGLRADASTDNSYMFDTFKTENPVVLNNLDTTNCHKFNYMFGYSQIPAIVTPKLSFANVEEAYNMFRNVSMDTLDLSMVDTSRITGSKFSGFVEGIKSTKCYARTQADADKLNTTGAPLYLHWQDLEHPFVVK